MPEDAGIEPRIVATSAMAVRALTTWLDLIHSGRQHVIYINYNIISCAIVHYGYRNGSWIEHCGCNHSSSRSQFDWPLLSIVSDCLLLMISNPDITHRMQQRPVWGAVVGMMGGGGGGGAGEKWILYIKQ